MKFIPIQTRVLQPPQDNLFDVLDEFLVDVREKDLVLVTSKVVAIHQGLCVPLTEDKRTLVESEAERWIEGNQKYYASPLAIKYNALLYAAGIDESNSGNFFTLLPKNPFDAAKDIWEYLKQRHGLRDVGVIVTDSHTQPLRWGVQGISIGFWGFYPVNKHAGRKDLFGREIKLSSTNIPDSVAAGATAVSGEADESTPVVIARDVPGVIFTEEDKRNDLLVEAEDDLFFPLLEKFYKKD